MSGNYSSHPGCRAGAPARYVDWSAGLARGRPDAGRVAPTSINPYDATGSTGEGKKRVATIQFLGAAREVTGSCYLLSTRGSRMLLECGARQGREDRKSVV